MKECVTHHHACDCREQKFAEMAAENRSLRKRLQYASGKLSEAMLKMNELCEMLWEPDEAATEPNRPARPSIVDRIDAAERYYRKHDERFADGMKHASEIAAPDGWQHIAPVWEYLNE
jgi:hypothetical protein